MTWGKFDDHMDENPKVAATHDSAFRLYVTAILYSNRSLSDGFIPAPMVRRLSTVAKPDKDAAALVRLGLWEPVDGGYRIHDFHDFQPTKAQVLAEREATRQRVANWRAGKKAASGNSTGNAVTNPVSNGGVTDSPYPFPPPTPENVNVENRDSKTQQSVRGSDVPLSRGAGANGAGPEGFEENVALSSAREATFHSSDFGANQASEKGVAVNENAPSPSPSPPRYDNLEPDYLSDAPNPDEPGADWGDEDEPDALDTECDDPYWHDLHGQRERQFRDAWARHPRPGDEWAARLAWRDAIADEIDFPGSDAERAITAALADAADHDGAFPDQLADIGAWIGGTGDEDEPHFSQRPSPFAGVTP